MPKTTEMANLTVNLDGVWSANELAVFLRCLEDLYNLLTALHEDAFSSRSVQERIFPLDRRSLRRFVIVELGHPALQVPSIRYASPGTLLAGGVAVAVAALAKLLDALHKYLPEERLAQRLDNELKQIQVLKEKEELQRRLLRAPIEDRAADKKTSLELQSLELDNEVKGHSLTSLELANLSSGLTIWRDIHDLSQKNHLPRATEQKMQHWIETKIKPLALLSEAGKLKGSGDNSQNN